TSLEEVAERPKVSEFSCHISGCSQVFDTLESYEHHYNTLHRNVCSFCKRSFPSGNLLDIHILEWHDSLFQIMAEKQNMYQCLVEGCTEKFKSSKDRKDHLVTVHLYPADFRFDRPKKCGDNLSDCTQPSPLLSEKRLYKSRSELWPPWEKGAGTSSILPDKKRHKSHVCVLPKAFLKKGLVRKGRM
uniref:Zinc finger protein 511 n=1 Tax=Malurus cyaneus samueli TaxID=2593467 RepID=A0A8C5TYV8_9PASS